MNDLRTPPQLVWRGDIRQATEWLIRDAHRHNLAAAVIKINSCGDRIRGGAVDAAERAVRSGVARSACACLHDGGLIICVTTPTSDGALAVGARIKWAVADAGLGVGLALVDKTLDTLEAAVKVESDVAAAASSARPGELLSAGAVTSSHTHHVEHALTTGELDVWFQPVVDLATDNIVAAIAVPRSKDDSGAFGGQRTWELVADDAAASDLATWALRATTTVIRTANTSRLVPIASAVTPRMLEDERFVNTTLDALSGIDANTVMLQLIDTGVRDLTPRAIAALRLIQGMGITLILDNFGVGNQSLQRLDALEWDIATIGRTLTNRAHAKDRHNLIATGAVRLIAQTGATCMIGGIEQRTDADALHAAGATWGYGSLWGRAVPFDTLTRRLQTAGADNH